MAFLRNITELIGTVTASIDYFNNLSQIIQQNSLPDPSNSSTILQDYPGCGIRNNDTFLSDICEGNNTLPTDPECTFTADFTAECLWDCTWMDNPHVGKLLTFSEDSQVGIIKVYSVMPKIPKDLRCLNNCTALQFPSTYNDKNFDFSKGALDCSMYTSISFLACYIILTRKTDEDQTFFLLQSENYFDMAVESCILAHLFPQLYSGTCDELGVNLRIFNPFLEFPYLVNSIPNRSPRIEGPSSSNVAAFLTIFRGNIWEIDPLKKRYPWLCSLRSSGYGGVHRCGVTLLSGPPNPIFVSAAHCNYLCKNAAGRVVPTCCCLESTNEFSCRDSDFCGRSPQIILADRGDLQIACNITNLELKPNGISPLQTKLLDIQKIIVHESYNQSIGPIGGYDISVYIVDAADLNLNPDYVWPACLPKADESYIPGNRGILAGWTQSLPNYFYDPFATTLNEYESQNVRERQALYERVNCADPAWMKSNTYYPPGTVCYTDAARASTVQFGVSGSGIVRPFLHTDQTGGSSTPRYSWIGPLSLSKGSDSPLQSSNLVRSQFSENPAVFTDASCYLGWIAAQYNLTLPAGYSAPDSCDKSSGNILDANNTDCLSQSVDLVRPQAPETLKCNFSDPERTKCRLSSFPNFNPNLRPATNANVFYCKNINGKDAVCANNCPGVDPNAVVVGGTALVLAPAVASVGTAVVAGNLLGPILGAGSILAAIGLGMVAMPGRRGACPPGQCRSRLTETCCPLVVVSGQRVCPNFCD
jgi:hypothetical protein